MDPAAGKLRGAYKLWAWGRGGCDLSRLGFCCVAWARTRPLKAAWVCGSAMQRAWGLAWKHWSHQAPAPCMCGVKAHQGRCRCVQIGIIVRTSILQGRERESAGDEGRA